MHEARCIGVQHNRVLIAPLTCTAASFPRYCSLTATPDHQLRSAASIEEAGTGKHTLRKRQARRSRSVSVWLPQQQAPTVGWNLRR